MAKPSNFRSAVRQGSPEIAAYILELEAENKRLNKQLARCRVTQLSTDNELMALKQELKKIRPVLNLNIGIQRNVPADGKP